jgi:glycosyltransferase involved in cell wall biosynthesis
MSQINLVGIVTIGRNEEEHLQAALESALKATPYVVYVDSGSTDNSLQIAAKLGVIIVELDPKIPFTAARAYNTGVTYLLEIAPFLEFVQFLDGDAQLSSEWVEFAVQAMTQNPEVAVVCGRRREKFPHQSIYNLLADMEWDTPIGEIEECGPESMMRLSHFKQVEGFDESLIAGEEPEICFRLRLNGGKILRIDADTSQHDMNMTQFRQWWRRSRRGGFAFAEEAWIHRQAPGHYRQRQCLRIWLWVFGMPLTALFLFPFTHGISLLLLPAGYGLNIFKGYRWAQRERQYSAAKALTYSVFCLLIKFPEWHGQLEFLWLKLLGRRRPIIEYKASTPERSLAKDSN